MLNNSNAPMLRILSIFQSIDGECNRWGPGTWSVFIKTATDKTHLKCGSLVPVRTVLDEVCRVANGVPGKVTIAGDEPLDQDWRALAELVGTLRAWNIRVSVETDGTHDVHEFKKQALITEDEGTCFVVDCKFNGQGGLPVHFHKLKQWDFVKMLIATEEDFHKAMKAVHELNNQEEALNFIPRIYFTPLHGVLKPSTLFKWMKENPEATIRQGVGINLQLYEYITSSEGLIEGGAADGN